MPITVEERADSPRSSSGVDPRAEALFTIFGTDSDVDARNTLAAQSDVTFDLFGNGILVLVRNEVAVEPLGPGLWEGFVRYGTIPETETSNFSFDTGGGTHHITNSLVTVGRFGRPGRTPPNFKGAIGVTRDDVEGVDIVVPIYQFSETHFKPNAFVTSAYKGILFALTGSMNAGPFKGFAAGECLFMGAAGTKRGLGDWEITYRFAGAPNATGLVFGDIVNVTKRGWDYLWISYEDVDDDAAHRLVKRPAAAIVEQVYREGNFGLMGIGI